MLTHLTNLPLHFGFQLSEMITEHCHDVSLVRIQTNIFKQRQSHSMRTSTVCISRNTLVTFSKPIIQPMYCSSIASRNGRFSRRLSILSTDGMAILFLSLNASVSLTIQWFLNFYFQKLLGQLSESLLSKHSTCVSRTYSQLQPKIGRLPISLYSPLGKLSEFSLSKHLTCAFRTRSQPQPVEIFSMLISRQVVGVFTVQTPHLCLQDLLPTSACRDTLSIPKPCHLRQSIDKSPSTNDLTVNMPQKWSET